MDILLRSIKGFHTLRTFKTFHRFRCFINEIRNSSRGGCYFRFSRDWAWVVLKCWLYHLGLCWLCGYFSWDNQIGFETGGRNCFLRFDFDFFPHFLRLQFNLSDYFSWCIPFLKLVRFIPSGYSFLDIANTRDIRFSILLDEIWVSFKLLSRNGIGSIDN